MSEKVRVIQDSSYQIRFFAPDPADPESGRLKPVRHLHELTPYGMLLASLGSCTTIVVHTYAQNHGIDLQEAEVHLEYRRNFKQDCENCEQIDRYDEQIESQVHLRGELTREEKEKLQQVSRLCSIHRLLESGVTIQAQTPHAHAAPQNPQAE
jgi:uncharacterized OsmC-like protein